MPPIQVLIACRRNTSTSAAFYFLVLNTLELQDQASVEAFFSRIGLPLLAMQHRIARAHGPSRMLPTLKLWKKIAKNPPYAQPTRSSSSPGQKVNLVRKTEAEVTVKAFVPREGCEVEAAILPESNAGSFAKDPAFGKGRIRLFWVPPWKTSFYWPKPVARIVT